MGFHGPQASYGSGNPLKPHHEIIPSHKCVFRVQGPKNQPKTSQGHPPPESQKIKSCALKSAPGKKEQKMHAKKPCRTPMEKSNGALWYILWPNTFSGYLSNSWCVHWRTNWEINLVGMGLGLPLPSLLLESLRAHGAYLLPIRCHASSPV